MPNKGVLYCYIGVIECINREINVLSILEFTELARVYGASKLTCRKLSFNAY